MISHTSVYFYICKIEVWYGKSVFSESAQNKHCAQLLQSSRWNVHIWAIGDLALNCISFTCTCKYLKMCYIHKCEKCAIILLDFSNTFTHTNMNWSGNVVTIILDCPVVTVFKTKYDFSSFKELIRNLLLILTFMYIYTWHSYAHLKNFWGSI